MIINQISYQLLKILVLFPLGIMAYLSPLTPLAYTILFFILADTITGIWAASTRKIKIVSSKSMRVVTKFIAYMIAILVAFVFDNHVIYSADLWVTRGTVFILSSIEVQSIFENLYKVTGIKLWDRLQHLFDKKEDY